MTPPVLRCIVFVALVAAFFLALGSHIDDPDSRAADAAIDFVDTDTSLLRVLGPTVKRRLTAYPEPGSDTDMRVVIHISKPMRARLLVDLDSVAGGWNIDDYTLFLSDTTLYATVSALPMPPIPPKPAAAAEPRDRDAR